jgi:hypothetical protein
MTLPSFVVSRSAMNKQRYFDRNTNRPAAFAASLLLQKL